MGARRVKSMVEAARDHAARSLSRWRFWPPVRAWGIFTRRFGYRGIALILFGLAFVGIGLGLPYSVPVPKALFYSVVPIPLRVLGWIGCGVVALVGAASKRESWQDRGFAVLLAPLLGERLLSYLIALVVEPDTLRWLSGGMVWFLFSGIVTLIAAWPEPSEAPPATPTLPLLPTTGA